MKWDNNEQLGVLQGRPVIFHRKDYVTTNHNGDEVEHTRRWVEWAGQKFSVVDRWDVRTVEIALERMIPFEAAEEISNAEKAAEESARKMAEAERREKNRLALRARLANPQTEEDRQRKEELMEVFENYISHFGSNQPPHYPYAKPFLYARSSHDNVLESIKLEEVKAMEVGKDYIHEGTFPCPFCGKTFTGKNGPCNECAPKITTEYSYEELENIQWDPFRERWPDVVKRYWRFYQYQCQCGTWADQPFCELCRENENKRQSLAKFRAATRTWIGKKVRAEWIGINDEKNEEHLLGPFVVVDVVANIQAEGHLEESGQYVFGGHSLEIIFSSSSFLKTTFIQTLSVNPEKVELEWEEESKYGSRKIIRLTVEKEVKK